MLQSVFNKVYQTYGFTLLELLAVVTVLSVILIVGIPVYTSYNLRSKTLNMLRMAEAAKLQVEQDYLKTGAFTSSTYAKDAKSFTQISNSLVSSITISNGVITITGNAAGLSNNAIVLTLQPTQGQDSLGNNNYSISWKCVVNSSNYLTMVPDICQHTS